MPAIEAIHRPDAERIWASFLSSLNKARSNILFYRVLMAKALTAAIRRLVYGLGLSWIGIGYIAIACTTSFPLMLLVTALTAIGGPMNDITRIFRTLMIFDNLFTLLLLLLSPFLFQHVPIRTVIFASGILTLLLGGFGLTKLSPPKQN